MLKWPALRSSTYQWLILKDLKYADIEGNLGDEEPHHSCKFKKNISPLGIFQIDPRLILAHAFTFVLEQISSSESISIFKSSL